MDWGARSLWPSCRCMSGEVGRTPTGDERPARPRPRPSRSRNPIVPVEPELDSEKPEEAASKKLRTVPVLSGRVGAFIAEQRGSHVARAKSQPLGDRSRPTEGTGEGQGVGDIPSSDEEEFRRDHPGDEAVEDDPLIPEIVKEKRRRNQVLGLHDPFPRPSASRRW